MKNHSGKTLFVPSQYGDPLNKEFGSLEEALSWGAENLDETAENITDDDESKWYAIKDFEVIKWKAGKHLNKCKESSYTWNCKEKNFCVD